MGKSRSRDRSEGISIGNTRAISSQLKISISALKKVDAKEPPPPAAVFADLPFVPPGKIINALKSNCKLHDDASNQTLMNQAIQAGNRIYTPHKNLKVNYQILVMDDPFIKGKKNAFEIYSPPPQSHIGKGGFGYVRFALNMETGEPVVLKFQDPSRTSKKEIMMLKKVESYLGDTLVAIDQEEKHVIAMDLARGQELSEWIDTRRRFNAAQRYNICVQAIRETIEAHRDRLIHSDIKPKNMMYDAVNGKLKMIDFGLAKEALEDEKTSELKALGEPKQGTPGYRAPEILGKDEAHYTAKTDIFALGVTIAQILDVYWIDAEGHQGPGNAAWLLPQKERSLSGRDDIEKLYPFLYRMLSHDPKQRPTLREALTFFEKMEAQYNNEKTRTKQVGILDVGEFLKANEKNRAAMLEALGLCTEVWLTAGAKANGQDYSKKDFLEARAILEQHHIPVGNQIAMNGKNQKLSAIELACQIPPALNREPKFIYNYVYVCAPPLAKSDAAKLSEAQIGSFDNLDSKTAPALMRDTLQKQQDLPAFQLKLHYMKVTTELEHKLVQFNSLLENERNKPTPDKEKLQELAKLKSEVEITLGALKTQYQHNGLSIGVIDRFQRECDILETRYIIKDINIQLEEEILRIRQKHGTTDPKVRLRIEKLELARDQLQQLQPQDNPGKNIHGIISQLRTELAKTDSSFFGIDTIKFFIDKQLKNYLDQHKKLFERLDTALKDVKAAPAAPKPK